MHSVVACFLVRPDRTQSNTLWCFVNTMSYSCCFKKSLRISLAVIRVSTNHSALLHEPFYNTFFRPLCFL